MNKEWFTSSELAGMPGLPGTDRNIRIKAKKEEWKSQKRAKGKGSEYHITSLPTETRAHIQKTLVSIRLSTDKPTQTAYSDAAMLDKEERNISLKNQKARMQSVIKLNGLPEAQQNRASARARVLELLDVYIEPFKQISQSVIGEKEFVKAFNAGELPVDDWVKGIVKKVSYSTLKRWQKQLKEEGVSRLAGNYESNQKPGIIEKQPEVQNYLIALITAKPHLAQRPHVMHRMLVEKAEEFAHWTVPAESSVSRWRNKWMANNGAKFSNLTDPDGYNNKHRPLFAKMYPWVSAPNDCWEFDSTPTDVQLNVNGKLVRYSIIAAIDVYTRRVKVLLAPTSSSEGICLLLRKCMLDWGTLNPGGLARTDNGSDYVSMRVSTIMQMLGLEQSKTAPFSGWEKPYIERFFGTMSRALFELLPGYICNPPQNAGR